MGFNTNIARRINRLSHELKDSLEESEIYLSTQMKEYLENLTGTLLGSPQKKLKVIVIADGPDGITAYTDGDTITMNYQTDIVTRYSRSEDRFIAFMGMFYHEMAHVMFNDFDKSNEAFRSLNSGTLYGERPDNLSVEDDAVFDEIKLAMNDNRFRQIISRVYADLDNAFSDRHDEDAIIDQYGGLCTSGIYRVRESLLSSFVLFDGIEEDVNNKKAKKFAAFYDALLEFSRFDTIEMSDKSLWNKSDILQTIQSVSGEIEAANGTSNVAERYTAMNRIVIAVWKYIKEELQEEQKKKESNQNQNQNNQNQQNTNSGNNNQQQNNGSQQSSGKQQQQSQNSQQASNDGRGNSQSGSNSWQNASDNALNEILNQMNNAGQNSSQMPTNRSSSSIAEKNRKENSGNSPQGSTSNAMEKSAQNSSDALNAIMEQVSKGKAESAVEGELAAALSGDIHAVNMNSGHKGVPIKAERKLDISDTDTYDNLMSEIKPYSKRLQKHIEEALKDIKEGGLVKYRPYGRVLRIQDTYRPDGLCYAKRKLPQDMPDMAISVLVDCSGSMSSYGRIEAAIKASILLYDFATGLDIPVAVAGHSTYGDAVRYVTYADYERANTKDKYRICSMHPSGCNRDGCALEIAANLLSKRAEEVKLLIIISDGQPNHQSYGGEAAAKDIQSIVRRYRSKGIEVIAAAIGSDKDKIKEIYGDGFVDIDDLSKLPRTLTAIVKKRILAYAV